MTQKMTNRQVEMFARIHVAVRASYFDAFEVDGTDTTNEDKERLIKAVHSFAEKTAKGQPMSFGKNSEIIDYVKKHF